MGLPIYTPGASTKLKDTHPHRRPRRIQDQNHESYKSSMNRLPNELLLDVLRNAPDFTTLHSLLATSHRLFLLFKENAYSIVEAVLSSTDSPQTESVMRVVLQLRTRLFRCKSLDEASTYPLEHSEKTHTINRYSSPRTFQKFVRLAHRIHLLSHSCLDLNLERCTSQLAVPEGLWRDPPSYDEEQRMVLGFWLLQYNFEIKLLQLDGPMLRRWNWTDGDISRLNDASLDEFYPTYHPRYFKYHRYAHTAYDFVLELRTSRGGSVEPPWKWFEAQLRWMKQYQLPTPPAPRGGAPGYVPTCQPRPPLVPRGSEAVVPMYMDLWAVQSRAVLRLQGTVHLGRIMQAVGRWNLRERVSGDRRNAADHLPEILLGNFNSGPYRNLGMDVWDGERIVLFELYTNGRGAS